ncbi:glycosyltransferase [Halobacterium zhouii]|uniref:glycosyltransferase n=1 Tax=Halobacterium zhouii TaxID=2902624 RepID=UPI001E2E46A1|nr:glycosyltransferase family 2 protein [Halobacterium zhouii]
MSPPPTSVLLPTTRWTPACDEVAAQLAEDDELLVVCDAETDPVADHVRDQPENVRLVVAGEPSGCSGKANAIAAGMDAARHDRVAWTDDDFRHPPDWLAGLHADYERHGPVSELPAFVGRDPLSMLLEPVYVLGGTASVYAGDMVWGGAVLFERDDLEVDAFLADLRRTVSDDGLLSEHLDATAVRRTRRVEIGGTVRESLERHVRFTKIAYAHDPVGMSVSSVGITGLVTASLLVPVYAFVVAALLFAGCYAAFGIRRWTAVLGYPALLASVPLLAYAYARRTFVWGGRRYRWRSKFDVELVE